MNTEKYMEYCFDNYSDHQQDYDHDDLDISGSYKKQDAKSEEEQRKIKKSIEDIIEQRRLKKETDFL